MDIKTQFEIFLKKINETHQNFYSKIEIPERTFSNQLKSSKGIYADVLLKIKRAYPELNLNWFLTGEGEILLPKNVGNVQQINSGFIGQTQFLNVQSDSDTAATNEGAYLKQIIQDKEQIIQEKERFIQMLQTLIPK